MARQCGEGTLLGTIMGVTGYADGDGRGLFRLNPVFDKRKWRTSPSFAGQRAAAELFGAASQIAGRLWAGLPDGMKRLCDAGAFNRLVGTCRMLVEEDQFRDQSAEVRVEDGRRAVVGDVDGMRGLDLSADSSGPHRVVKSEQRKVKSGGGGDESGLSYRLTGMRSLMEEIDLAVGDRAGRKSGKYLVAHRYLGAKLTKAPTDGNMGSLAGWRKVKSEQLPAKSGVGGAVKRRFRVWVQAVELVEPMRMRGKGKFSVRGLEHGQNAGFVTPWEVVGGYGWAFGNGSQGYRVEGKLDFSGDGDGERVFVVFTGIEVAELRGRHWVRLPWCCKVRVQDVVEEGDLMGMGDVETLGNGVSDISGHSIPEHVTSGCETERTDACIGNKAVLMGSGIRAGPCMRF